MERSNQTWLCKCKNGNVVLRTSCRDHSYGQRYYACPNSKTGKLRERMWLLYVDGCFSWTVNTSKSFSGNFFTTKSFSGNFFTTKSFSAICTESPDNAELSNYLQEEAAPAGEQSSPPAPKTAKQLTTKRNQERVKSILLSSRSTSNSQNLAFLSSENTSSTMSSTAKWKFLELILLEETYSSSQFQSTPGGHVRLFRCAEIHRSKTRRILISKEKQTSSFDKSKIECYNCHRKWHFAKECKSRRNQGKRSYGDNWQEESNNNEPSSTSLLSRVHHTFHVSNLKKCYADEPLVMPLEGIHVDDKLQFVEEPVEIMEREIKRLKRSRIPLVKVRWNSRRGSEFTWEREDSFKQKYPQLFTNRASSSTTRS
ncbi:putative reverse transcriptase domain-containing protein [Tanacetum coccineum]